MYGHKEMARVLMKWSRKQKICVRLQETELRNSKDVFTPPPRRDRNCRCEKCLRPKGPVPQDEKLGPTRKRSSVKSSQDIAVLKDGSNWKVPRLSPRPALTSPKQQRSHNEERSNGAKAKSRKRTAEDLANADNTTNSKGTGLPKELTAKFGALKCGLCNVWANSTVQSDMHYRGKVHAKKVNQFLANWNRETGQPVPKRAKESTAAKKVALEPKERYCTVCDLPLSSVQHAQEHYMGKSHQRAVQVLEMDPDKWKRLFYCELCQVIATSKDKLKVHLKDAKHRKAEKAARVGTKASSWVRGSNVAPCPSISPPAPSDSILASVIKTKDALSRNPGIKKYCIYRTPSGEYYCRICTLICNSEVVLHNHMISKNHAKHEKAKKEKEAAAQEGNENAKEFLSNLRKAIRGNVEKMSSNLFFCKLCNLSVKSKEELERHIATKKHMEKVGKADPYICNLCNMSLESEEHLAQHCTQEEHKKNLKQDT